MDVGGNQTIGRSGQYTPPSRGKKGAKPVQRQGTQHADPVVQRNIQTAEDAYKSLFAHKDFKAKAQALGGVSREQLNDVADKLGVPKSSRREFREAMRTTLSWLDPASLSSPEREAVERMEADWKQALKEAHPQSGKLAQTLHVLGSGALAGMIGFAFIAFCTKLGVARFGPTGVRVMYFGGPALLLVTEPVAGAVRARGPHYAGVNTGAHSTHDVLEREYKGIEWEAWFVAKKKAKAPAADKAGWESRLRDLDKKGDLVRINQQRNFADMLRRQLGKTLNIKSTRDNKDEPSMLSSCCCSKVRAYVDNDDNAIVTYNGTELFRLANPAEFKTFKQGGKAEVIWTDGNGTTQTTDLNQVRVPKAFEHEFLDAQSSMAWNEFVLAMVCDEMTFMPLVLMLALTAPMGIWMNRHPAQIFEPKYMDALLAFAGSTVGMAFTALSQNAARSYLSGANVISKRDEEIQAKLHALANMKEDMYDARILLADQLIQLATTERSDTKAAAEELRQDMATRTEQLGKDNGVTHAQFLAYWAARRKAVAEGGELVLDDHPEIQKMQEVIEDDDELHNLQAKHEKLRISEKLDALKDLGSSLSQQRKLLVEARDKQTHDRHAAGNVVNSLTTAIADTWKNLGRKTTNLAAMALSFTPAFSVYADVFILQGIASFLPASGTAQPVNGTESINMTTNSTAPGVNDIELLPAMGFAMTAGLLVLMPLLSQRRGLFLWPLHRIIYDGYGIAKGVKAYVYDAPPEVEPRTAIDGAAEENEGAQTIMIESDEPVRPKRKGRPDPLNDYAEKFTRGSQDDRRVVIPFEVRDDQDSPRGSDGEPSSSEVS